MNLNLQACKLPSIIIARLDVESLILVRYLQQGTIGARDQQPGRREKSWAASSKDKWNPPRSRHQSKRPKFLRRTGHISPMGSTRSGSRSSRGSPAVRFRTSPRSSPNSSHPKTGTDDARGSDQAALIVPVITASTTGLCSRKSWVADPRLVRRKLPLDHSLKHLGRLRSVENPPVDKERRRSR